MATTQYFLWLCLFLLLITACTTQYTQEDSLVIAKAWVQEQQLCADMLLTETQKPCTTCWTFSFQCRPQEEDIQLDRYTFIVPVFRGAVQDPQIIMGDKQVDSFVTCIAAGYDVTSLDPRTCTTPQGTVFIEELGCTNACGNDVCEQGSEGICDEDSLTCPQDCEEHACEGFCGDGICTTFVCLDEECSCLETAHSCPQDCSERSICTDQCGDGTCQEIVCMGQGCPCAENAQLCPTDCSAAS